MNVAQMVEPEKADAGSNRRTPKEFAAIIRERDAGTVQSIFDTANMVQTAFLELGGTARWLGELIQGELKWSKTKGFGFKKIAECEHGFSGVNSVNLPSEWSILYGLARLTEEEFQKGVDTGIIHAGMARKDISALKPPKPKKQAEPPKRPEAISPQDFCSMTVRRLCFETVNEIPKEQLEDFFADIESQIADLKAKTLGE